MHLYLLFIVITRSLLTTEILHNDFSENPFLSDDSQNYLSLSNNNSLLSVVTSGKKH